MKLKLINPSTNEVLGEIEMSTESEIKKIVAAVLVITGITLTIL